MTEMLWQTPEQRAALLKRIVGHPSVTLSQGERDFPYFLQGELKQLAYFESHPEHIVLTPTGDGRHAVLAYYTHEHATDTIVLISHHDTVGIEDFGVYQDMAFDMDRITAIFEQDHTYLDAESIKDMKEGIYSFGRGSMDMKPGLMLHMSLIEKAIAEQWKVNLVLVSVPDEEVNSLGMRRAMAALADLKVKHNWHIALHLNSEPTFQQATDDNDHYVYTGSIGKIMPSALCFGRETHVGNALSGVSSNLMLSYINQEMEYQVSFKETYRNEHTPLPVSLLSKDIKDYYDVQTPFRSVGLFNVFLFERNADDAFKQFNYHVIKAIERFETKMNQLMVDENETMHIKVNVLTFEQLLTYAKQQYDEAKVETVISQAIAQHEETYQQSIAVVDALMGMCKKLAPAVVTFFAPPYYPAVNASDDPLIEALVETAAEVSQTAFQRTSNRLHYFNGISDLSYAQYRGGIKDSVTYEQNTPVYHRTYDIPFDAIEHISAPVFNCGPIGKDAHKVNERINMVSACEELPVVLETLIKRHFLN